jgi:replicative DNA helicase
MDEARGKIEFIVAKRRRGCTGTTHGRFYGAFQAVRG